MNEYRDLIRMDPQNSFALYRLGYALLRLGKYDEAIEALRNALELHPESAEPHTDLGWIYRRRHQYAESEKELRRAFELDPTEAEPLAILGAVMSDQGRLQEAEAFMKRAVQVDPNSSNVHQYLGVLYMHEKRFDDAIREGCRAFGLAPSFGTARLLIAPLLRKYWLVALPVYLLILYFVGETPLAAWFYMAMFVVVGTASLFRGVANVRTGERRRGRVDILIGCLALTAFTLSVVILLSPR